MPRSGIDRSYGSSMFNFLRKSPTTNRCLDCRILISKHALWLFRKEAYWSLCFSNFIWLPSLFNLQVKMHGGVQLGKEKSVVLPTYKVCAWISGFLWHPETQKNFSPSLYSMEIPFLSLSVCSSYEKSVHYLNLPDSERKTLVQKLLIRKCNWNKEVRRNKRMHRRKKSNYSKST